MENIVTTRCYWSLLQYRLIEADHKTENDGYMECYRSNENKISLFVCLSFLVLPYRSLFLYLLISVFLCLLYLSLPSLSLSHSLSPSLSRSLSPPLSPFLSSLLSLSSNLSLFLASNLSIYLSANISVYLYLCSFFLIVGLSPFLIQVSILFWPIYGYLYL